MKYANDGCEEAKKRVSSECLLNDLLRFKEKPFSALTAEIYLNEFGQ
jgi:hypothetical protein